MPTAVKTIPGVPKPMGIHFGKWLKDARAQKGWTQQSLADKAEISKAQVSRLESGEQGTKLTIVVRLAEALDQDPRRAVAEMMRDTPNADDLGEELPHIAPGRPFIVDLGGEKTVGILSERELRAMTNLMQHPEDADRAFDLDVITGKRTPVN